MNSIECTACYYSVRSCYEVLQSFTYWLWIWVWHVRVLCCMCGWKNGVLWWCFHLVWLLVWVSISTWFFIFFFFCNFLLETDSGTYPVRNPQPKFTVAYDSISYVQAQSCKSNNRILTSLTEFLSFSSLIFFPCSFYCTRR